MKRLLNKQVFTRFDHRFPLHVARLVRPWFGCLACLFLLFLSCGCVFDDETGGGAACFRRTMSRFSGFDPVHSPDVYSAKSAALIYECLLQYSYLDRPYRVEPCLARELPEISEDGLDIVFRLREGIFFSDNK